jgi:osmotically-inducible protein OsmY
VRLFTGYAIYIFCDITFNKSFTINSNVMKNGNGKHSHRHTNSERDSQGRFTNEDDNSRGGSNRSSNRQYDSDQNLMDWDQNDRRNERSSDQDYDTNRTNYNNYSDNDSRNENSRSDRNRSNRNRNDHSNNEGGSYGNYSSGGYNSGVGSFSGSNYSSAGFGGGNYGVGNYGSGSYGSGSSGIGNVSNYSSGGTRGTDFPSQGNNWSDTEESNGSRSGTSHRGKGPKGYKRSDERIQEDINDRLTDDHSVDASEIDVKVDGGEVILSGTVSDRNAKRRAEDIAEQISGVSNVQNNIRVSKGDSSASSTGNESKTKTNGKH